MIIGYENGRHNISFSASSAPDTPAFDVDYYFSLRGIKAFYAEVGQILQNINYYPIKVYDKETLDHIYSPGLVTYKHSGREREPKQGDVLHVSLMDQKAVVVKQISFEINSSKRCYNSELGGFDYLLQVSEL